MNVTSLHLNGHSSSGAMYRPIKGSRKYKPSSSWKDSNQLTASLDFSNLQASKKQPNYLQTNKKNLRNFFKDRIVKESLNIHDKQPNFSPTKIFEYRVQQDKKQSETKINLKSSMEIPTNYSTIEIKKMNETFALYNKAKGSRNKFKTDSNYALNRTYQTATHSSLIKRKQICKKQAYMSVFGDDSKKSGRIFKNISNPQTERKSRKLPSSTMTMKKKINTQKDKEKFREVLKKIQDFARVHNLTPQAHLKQQNSLQKFSRQTTQDEFHELKNGMVTCIQTMSDTYKKKIQAISMKKVNQIQDMDGKFVEQLKKHKQSRLKVRNQGITEVFINTENQIQVDVDKKYKMEKKENIVDQQFMQRERSEFDLEAILTITDRNKNTIEQQVLVEQPLGEVRRKTRKEKMRSICDNIIKSNHEASIFGIKIENIYNVLWKERKSFELEGSYAFFKFVKTGNLPIIQNFIEKDLEFAYQIDGEGRTALLYAVQNNQYEVVEYFLTLGFNVNKPNECGFTPVYYAVKNGNVRILEALLKYGGYPWSKKEYSLKAMLEISSKQVTLAIKNARRVDMACRLCNSFISKKRIWEKFKSKITGKEALSFI